MQSYPFQVLPPLAPPPYTANWAVRFALPFPRGGAGLPGQGLRVRSEKGRAGAPGTVRILTEEDVWAGGGRRRMGPKGTRVEIDQANPPLVLPPTEHAFVVRRRAEQAPWIIGRAEMQYRDLVPSRLGGAMIASHIRIPDVGHVPYLVHFTTAGFPLLFCNTGRGKRGYADQGTPNRLTPGDWFNHTPENREGQEADRAWK